MAKLYEITFLLDPALSEEDARNFGNQAEAKIGELGSSIKSSLKQTRVELGYEIKKQKSAWRGSITFEGENQILSGLETFVKQQSGILRHVLVGTKPAPPPYEPRRRRFFEPAFSSSAAPVSQPSFQEPKPQFQEKPKEPKVDIKEIEKKLEELLQ